MRNGTHLSNGYREREEKRERERGKRRTWEWRPVCKTWFEGIAKIALRVWGCLCVHDKEWSRRQSKCFMLWTTCCLLALNWPAEKLSQLRARIFRNHGSNGSVSENKSLEGTVFCSPWASEARTQHLPPGPETREFSLRDLVVLSLASFTVRWSHERIRCIRIP